MPPSVGDDISRSLKAMGKAVQDTVKTANRDAGKVSKEEHLATARASTGGDLKFSNFKGPKLGVRLRVDPGGCTVSPSGPWKIAEEGAAPHGGHPGTRATQGVKAWSRARDAAVKRLDRDIPADLDRAVGRAFRG